MAVANPTEPQGESAIANTGRFRVYLRAFALPFTLALAFLGLEAVCDLLQPTIMASIVDKGIAGRDIGRVLSYGLDMLLVAGVGAIGAVGRNLLASQVSWRLASRLRSDLLRSTLSLGFRELEGFDTASLVTRETNDVVQVQAFVNGMMRIFAKAPIIAIGSIVMATRLEPRLAPVFLVVIPLASLLIAFNLRSGFKRFRRVQEGIDAVNARVREFLSGIRLVKAYGREDREEALFAGANARLAAATTGALRAMAFLGPVSGLVVNLGLVAILWWGGLEVRAGTLPLGHVIAFVTYLSQLLFALIMISGVFTVFVRARVSWTRILEVLESKQDEPITVRRDLPAPRKGPSIAVKGLSFRYGTESAPPILEDLDFLCEPGSLTALIGPTGSGKTSFINLLPRFHDPSSGRILLDGVDLRDLDLGALRARIGLVPQRSLLFSGTIAENLRWGRAEATQAELEEAASLALAHEFIAALPAGYESRLGQGGVNLSGGQRQRLALARALARRPSLLILDDCTSSVDAITEARILAGLRGGRGAMTILLVTQRISAARDADRILVLDGGKMAGFGSHEELAAASVVYRDIIAAQLGTEALDVIG